MRKLAWLCSFCLWPLAAVAGQNTSAYTPFDLEKTCLRVEKGDGMTFAGTWRCAGFGGKDIVVSVDDDRAFVGFGPDARQSCAYRKTFNRFNEALSPVEWRLRDGSPVAVIERWRVTKDDAGNTATWLVVSALRQGEACPVHYVAGSYPEANVQARRAADSLAEAFDCRTGVPTYDSTVGPPPVEFIACSEEAE